MGKLNPKFASVIRKAFNLLKILLLYRAALHQKDTNANFAYGSPLFLIRRNSFVEIRGWVNPAPSEEGATLRADFANAKSGLNNIAAQYKEMMKDTNKGRNKYV